MEMHAFILSILLLTILSGSEARSVDQVCSEKCTSGIRQFFVKDDFEYSYTYLTTVESSFHTGSAQDQKAQLSIEVPFSIITSTDCNLVLQVKRGIYIDNRTPRNEEELEWQEALTAYPLHFSWQNGVVESVCPSTNEPAWVANFKRGILSAIQVSKTTSTSAVKELDVSGDCEADYFVQNDAVTVITKTKDYTKCTNRNKHLLFSWSLPYDISSPRQNYIHSQQSCRHYVADVLQNVECTEEHVFRPFSTDEAGARTNIMQRIRFVGQRRLRSTPYARVTIRHSDLAFEEESEVKNSNMEEKSQAAKDLLTEICATMEGETYQNVGVEFITLVHAIRELDAESLTDLNLHADTCTEWRSALKQMLSNTLPFCGTESCVTFATSLMTDNSLEKAVAERWLTGFGLIKNPTEGMISSILDVVESGRYPEQSFLATGSMIHQFCQNSEENCMNNRVIGSSVEVLMQHLGTNCRSTNPESRKMTLLALRSIGNAGQTTSSTTLKRCIEETGNPMETRIAAADAYRRMACSVDRSALMGRLQDPDEDSEMRIDSYMNLMKCPTADLVRTVKNMLETEENMQVGSFIWSHLNQVIESQDPLKSFFQVLLNGHTFKDFSLDPRKYSRYYEGSLFSEKLNSGGTAEANLVWSPKSFVPRAASVNLTVDLFGQAVNVFEFGGRVEGVENYLQSVLEPKAYKKRMARNDLQPFGSERRRNSGISAADKAQASWFMRVFGNELIYGNTDIMESIEAETSNFFSDVMAKFMSEDGYNFHDDALILNSIHTLPTGNGLPLQVAFNGSTTVDVNAAGRFSMGFGSSAEYLVRGKVTPRAALVITGSMSVDAHVRRTGIAAESVAYSSNSMSGYVKISDNGRAFDIEIDSPYDTNMAFNFNHKLLKIEGESVIEIGGRTPSLTQNEDTTCTDEFLGQRLCFNKLDHNSGAFNDETSSYVFPTNGEVSLSAYMEKTDRGLTKYTMSGNTRTQYENKDDTIPQNLLLRLSFDTPGSHVNRKTNTFFSYSIPERQISIRAQQGERTLLQLQGEYHSDDHSNGVSVSAEYKDQIYRFEADTRRTLEDNRKMVSTEVSIVLPSKTMTINGMVDYQADKRFQASFEMNNVLPTPVVMRIDLQDNSESQDMLVFSGNGKVTLLPFINSEFIMDMDMTPRLDNLVFNLNYKIGGRPKQSVLFHHKRTNLGRTGETDWTISQMFTASQFTALNHKVSVSHKYSKGSTTSNIDIGYGERMEEPDNDYKLELRQEYSDTSDESTTRVNGQFAINFPLANINRELGFSHLRDADVISTKIDNVVNGNPFHFTFLWKNNVPGSTRLNQNLEIALYPSSVGEWRLVHTVQEVEQNVYQSVAKLTLGDIEELQYITKATFTNKAVNKSIEFLLTKEGDETGIMEASSVNYVVGTKYVSKNLVHVFDLDRRGLNIVHDKLPMNGFKTSIDFIAGSNVVVGLDLTSKPTENGNHFSLGSRQYDVSERVILAKFGYDHIPQRLFDTYATLTDNDETRFALRTTTRLSSQGSSGNFMVAAKGHPSLPFSRNIDCNVTLSYDIGDTVELDLSSRCMSKNLHVTAVTADNGIHGIIQHNYCDYMNDASYNIARTADGVNVMFSSGGRQAHARATVSENSLEFSFDHERMQDLMEFSVPTEASVTLRKNPKNSPTNLQATVSVDHVTAFDMSYSSSPANRFAMSNELFSILPSSASWQVESSSERLQVTIGLNSEDMRIIMVNNFPESGSMKITHSFELIEQYIPNDFTLSYDGRVEPGLMHFNVVMGDKVVTFDANMYSNSHIKVDLITQGIQFLPHRAMIELQGEVTSERMSVNGDAQYNDDTYGVSFEASSNVRPGTTFLPYTDTVGTHQSSLRITQGNEMKWSLEGSSTVTEDRVDQRYELYQSLTDIIPASLVEEQHMVMHENEFSLLRKKTENNVKVSHYELRYVPGTIRFTQTYTKALPELTVVTYDVGMEHGTVTVQTEMEETKTASVSYSIFDRNGFEIQASHNWDIISSIIPSPVKFTGSLPSDGNSVQSTYQLGTEKGSMRLWKNTMKNMGLETNSNDFSCNFTYHLKDNGIMVSSQCRCKEHSYGMKFDGGFELNEAGTALKNIHGNLDAHADDKSFMSRDFYEIRGKSLFVNMTCKQTITDKLPASCNFTRTFTFEKTSNSVDVQIDGTTQDPFFLKVTLSYDLNSVTAKMLHNQDSWSKIPKTFIAKFEKSQQDKSYAAKASVTMDETTTAATATLSYTIDETSGSLSAQFTNEFSSIPYLPQSAGISASGSMANSQVSWKITATCDDKLYNETGLVNYAEAPAEFSVQLFLNQNLVPIYPPKAAVVITKTENAVELVFTYNDKKITFRIDLSDAGLTITATEVAGVEITPSNFGMRWTKEPVAFELTHDLSILSPLPQNLAVQANTDDGNLRVTIGADSTDSEFSVRKVMEDGNVRFILEHNLDILSPIPRNAELAYQKSPRKATLVWEESEISLEEKGLGFVFKQNVFEPLPKVITFSTNFDLTSSVKLVELSGAVDEYAVYYKMTLQNTETYSMTLLCKLSKAEESLMHLDISTEVTGTQGSEKVMFSQSLSESVAPAYSYSVEYNLGKTAGMISFEAGIEDPVQVELTYSGVEAMSLRYGLVHNVDAITSVFPFRTTGEASVQWTETRKNIRATVLSRQISFDLVTDTEGAEKSIAATISHDFDIIETSLFIPKSAQINLYGGPTDYEAAVSYTIDSQEKHLKLHTDVESESEIVFTIDQNILEPPASTYSRRRSQFLYPQKASLRLIKDDATRKAMLSFKTGQKRRYFNIEYTFTASQSASFFKVKVLQNLNRIVRKQMPNDLELSVSINSTAASVNMQWDENNLDLVGHMDRSENFRAGFTSTHNAPDLTKNGVPSDINFVIQSQPLMTFAFNYGENYAGRLTVKQPVINTRDAITVYVKVEEIKITASTYLSLPPTNGFHFEVSGTQSGLDSILPSNFQFSTEGSYDDEARTVHFSSTHNIDVLDYPKSVVATFTVPRVQEHTFEGGYRVNADGMRSENSIRMTWAETTHGYELTTSGVRTENFFSRSPSDRLSFNGKTTAELDSESEQKSLKWVSEYTETNEDGEAVLEQTAHVMGTMTGKTVTWGMAANVPPYLEEGFTNTGSLTYASDYSFNNEYRRGDYHVSINLSGDAEQNFRLGMVNKYGEMSLVFDKTLPEQFKFSHNIELMSVIPSSIIIAYNTATKTASIRMKGVCETKNYDGKMAIDMTRQNSFRWTYELTEINADGETILEHSAHIIGALTDKTVTWDIAATLPPYLEEGFTSTGSLTFASEFALNYEYRRRDYHVIMNVSGSPGKNFRLDIDNKYGELSLVFDKARPEQLVFTHNIEMMSMIPNSVTFALNSEAKTMSIRASFSDGDLVINVQQYYFKATYTSQSEEIVNIHGQYSSHPTQKVTSTIKVMPLNIDYSSVLEMQFFRPGDGQSLINLSILDNVSRRGITSRAYALLQNSDIRDVRAGASISSNFTNVPLNFALGFALAHDPLSYDATVQMGRYSVKVNGTRKGSTFLLNLPAYYKVHELLIENTYDMTDSSSEYHLLIQWNGNKKIGYKTTAGWTENLESLWAKYEIYQPFANPMEVTAGYQYEQRNGWHVVTTTVTDDGRPFTVISKYKKYERKQTTHRVVMDVRQSYAPIVPQRFITTTVVTLGKNLFDSDFKLSAGGEDLFTAKKHFEVSSDSGNARVSWTHPFEDLYFSSFDGSLNWELGSDSLTVVSDVTHSEDSKYLPKHFTTTGKLTVNSLLYENDWKVSGDGEDLIVYYEKLEMLDNGIATQIKWKHPFEEIPLNQYDGTLSFDFSGSTVNVDSEISHSGTNKYIPSNFVTTGRMTVSDMLYDSKWKIVSEGQELVVLNKIFRQIENGYKVVVNWKQPYEEFGLTAFDLDSTFTQQSNTMDVNVDISHSLDNHYIPKRFVTTGVVTVGDKLYDSDWKITSGGENLFVSRHLFRGTDNGLNMEVHWQQPCEFFPVKTLDANVVFTTSSAATKFTGTLQYNDAEEFSTDISSVASNSYSRNYTVGFTANGQRYESKSYLAKQQWATTGDTVTFIYDNTMPEECSLAKYLPARQHFDLTIFKKGFNTKFSTVYSSSFLPYPLKVEGSVVLSQGATMLDSSLSFKNSAESNEGMDLVVKLNIDRETGVTVGCKIPSFGLDESLNLKYDQRNKRVTITFLRAGQEPIVVTINMNEFIPRMKQIIQQLKEKNIIPEVKFISDINRNGDTFDAYAGVRVRDISYKVHVSSGYADGQGYFNITTKRDSKTIDTVVSITAKLIDQETAQIQIQTSKKLGRFLNYALSSSTAELKDKVVTITDALTEALQSFEGIVQGSDRIERAVEEKRTMLLERVSQVKAMTIEFLDNANTGILDSMNNGEEEINSGLWKAITALSAGIDRLLEIVKRPLEELKHDYLSQVSTEVFDAVEPVLRPVVNLLNNFHAGQLLLELVQEGITKFVFTMEKNAETLLIAAREPLAKLVLVSEDRIIFNIPLRVPVKGLIAPPSMGDISMWIAQSSLTHEIKAKLEILYQVIDLYYQYRSVLNMPLDEIIPPFKGHAEISGFRHVRTFDGKRYDYKSECGSKHVLVRDESSDEFTVAITYGSRPAIEIVTLDSRGGEEIIVLKPDYSVTDERGRDIVVPNEYEDVIVKRIGEIIRVQTVYGLVISCNFMSDICTIDVSPSYFARLGGMLGTFNNEPNDDYMAPGMVKVSDSEELALSWMQPGSCSGNNEEQRCTVIASERCTELFEGQNSAFASCFPVEDAAPYKEMCMKDSCSDNGICSAVASYARRCALRGVNLPTPPRCMNCMAVGGDSFQSAGEVEVRGADVVFVIERSGCMRFRKKEYKKLVGEIHTTLNATIATGNINYAVVGFGGPDNLAEPHTVTFGSDIFMHPRAYDMTNAEEKSILNALKRGEKSQDGESDILQALAYASQLPFRAGAARTIILMTCNDCSGNSEISTGYVRGLLQDQGIVVHHLRQQSIQAGRAAKKVYGFNSREIFSKTSSNLPRMELKSSGNDQCIPLADMSGGSVWNANLFGRESLPLVVGEISNGVSAASTQECICGMSEFGTTAKCISTL